MRNYMLILATGIFLCLFTLAVASPLYDVMRPVARLVACWLGVCE